MEIEGDMRYVNCECEILSSYRIDNIRIKDEIICISQ